MSYSMSMKLHPKQTQSLKQNQLLMMLPQMQQAIGLLQIPVMEMVQIIEQEMERNPVLELSDDSHNEEDLDEILTRESAEEEMNTDTPVEQEISFHDRDFEVLKQIDEEFRDHFAQTDYIPRSSEDDKKKAFLENSLQSQHTLFTFLMEQARQTFENKEDLQVAETIIGNFDERGYLQMSLEELSTITHYGVDKIKKIIEQIQTFEPYGVGATNVQDCLLIQLRCMGKANSLAYRIIENHYDDLIHNRIPLIQKKLGVSYDIIRNTIDEQIAKLDLKFPPQFTQRFSEKIMDAYDAA